MISSFWTGFGGKIAERWATALFTPALAFWALGGAAWLLGAPDPLRRAVIPALEQLSGVTQGLLVVVALMVVLASSVVAERLALTVLRVCEGYWSWPLRGLAGFLVHRKVVRFEALGQRWLELHTQRDAGTMRSDEERELVELENRLAALPSRPGLIMPTRLGNVLRAAESGVEDKYGIDPVRCWTAMWLLLPESTRAEVTAARAALDSAAAWVFWSLAVALWTVLTPWALLAAAVALPAAYRTLLGAASRYADLVDATFALHRGLLYDALGRSRPSQPDEEQALGQQLTTALWRGPELAEQLARRLGTDDS